MDNPIYSFKKLQLLIYKLIIKFKMIYSIIPENTLKQINEKFSLVNDKKKFEKSPEALQKYEEKDDVSEYDDGGEYIRDYDSKEENTTIKSENKSSFSPDFVSSNSDSK